MSEFLKLLIGTDDLVSFASLLVLAFIGVLLSLLLHANKRNPLSLKSPVPFSWGFLITDNLRRIFTGIILVFVALRFSEQFLGAELNPFLAFVAGAGIDRLANLIQVKTKIKRHA